MMTELEFKRMEKNSKDPNWRKLSLTGMTCLCYAIHLHNRMKSEKNEADPVTDKEITALNTLLKTVIETKDCNWYFHEAYGWWQSVTDMYVDQVVKKAHQSQSNGELKQCIATEELETVAEIAQLTYDIKRGMSSRGSLWRLRWWKRPRPIWKSKC